MLRKTLTLEIEQLNGRLADAEARLKAEVLRIKKKMQITITELEMSLDVANKNNIELQKQIKKLSLQLTELQAHYDDVQRQLQATLDQYGIAQRRIQALSAENEELRGNLDQAQRQKRAAEDQAEEFRVRINELQTINVNLTSVKSKLEQELGNLTADYDEVTKELKMADDRCMKVQSELKHTTDILNEEQVRIVKIETIKKSLEVELRDLELEFDNEKRRHAETLSLLRKKERNVKELMVQMEEDQANIALLKESLDKSSQKVNLYKRQLADQEATSAQNINRVRRFQRELEAAEARAETAEGNMNMIRTKHRSFVTQSAVPGGSITVVQESRHFTEE
ncbi:Paramyosin, short form [Amphibalanus amphitrite]|uniref:Paramyosin, short form n=1 Tax=Amphibalanus amphitrite TaxID=1232801 RepID=A0A6A4WTV7_AMPAM|nr:Paramyosin, short form [Amphibalanus amphitrite]